MIAVFFFSLMLACSDDTSDRFCFSFDERSCQTDLWLEGVEVPADVNDRMALLSQYLERQDLQVIDISVDPTFHEIVCQACDVCPNGPRFFVTSKDISLEDLSGFRLLNLQEETCD